jgi:predicted DNA binding CopG/RHH family protein
MVNNKSKKKRDKKISLNVTNEEYKALKLQAEARGMSMSAHIRNKSIYEAE